MMRVHKQIESMNILVIGDVMIDTYYDGDVNRISPEAPVPVFRKHSERSVLGGAANVANNLVAAGQNVSVMAIMGNDENGKKLKSIFETEGINTELVVPLDRKTTEKIRFLAGNNQQVLRLDIEDTKPLEQVECNELIKRIESRIEEFDLILISDYLKGLLTYEFTQAVLQLAKRHAIKVIVDVKDTNYEKYKDAYLLKPNRKELKDLTKMSVNTDEDVIKASYELKERCNAQYVLTTCGARGMVLVGDEEPYFIDSVGQEVFDVTGAGDTTIAYLAACIVNDMDINEAVDVANIAAGIQVSKVGTSAVYWKEIKEVLASESDIISHKILLDKEIDSFRKDHADEKIVFTNGCFDILHTGHVRYLQAAAKLGDVLIIGLNSDASVKHLKGESRPINNEHDRAELLCALGFVDYVVYFEEDTPYELIKKVQPDILVKGGDYKPENVVGRDIVEMRGGKLVLIPLVEGKSTTNIIEKIGNHDG